MPCFPRRPRRFSAATTPGVTAPMHGSSSNTNQSTQAAPPISRPAKPAPPAPAPAPAVAPPAPPSQPSPAPTSTSTSTSSNTNKTALHTSPTVNGTNASPQKTKKKNDAPVDPAIMYESLKNRIAALEEEGVIEEEEERRFSVSVQSVLIMLSSSV